MEGFAEYLDPLDYDCEQGAYGGPGFALVEALARETGGPLLDLACGTGRIGIPLARQGFAVTGIDLTPGMVELARRKSEGLGRWLVGDCRDFRLSEQFRLAFLMGHAFQAFLDRPAQEAMLARVREHLHPQGRFLFDTRNPVPLHLATDLEETPWHTYVGANGRAISVSGFQRYDQVRQVQRYTTYRRWTGSNGRTALRTTTIDLRYEDPQELERLLHGNGFAIERWYGDWSLGPVTAESPEIICICRPA